jgi:hypothetical protein
MRRVHIRNVFEGQPIPGGILSLSRDDDVAIIQNCTSMTEEFGTQFAAPPSQFAPDGLRVPLLTSRETRPRVIPKGWAMTLILKLGRPTSAGEN